MLLADIKKFAKKRAQSKNTTSGSNRNVYGGVGLSHDYNTETTPIVLPDVTGSGDGGGDGGGGE